MLLVVKMDDSLTGWSACSRYQTGRLSRQPLTCSLLEFEFVGAVGICDICTSVLPDGVNDALGSL